MHYYLLKENRKNGTENVMETVLIIVDFYRGDCGYRSGENKLTLLHGNM